MTAIKILRTVAHVRQWRYECLKNRKRVGFVPTMGALHDGHCSLVNQSLKDNETSIVSIFVNPSQFAPHEDLESYPKTLDSDLSILQELAQDGKGVEAVFVPNALDIYPSGITVDVLKQKGTFVNVVGCSEQLEGKQRPQFFRGVATVVTKLLNVVQPTNIYFGQKDAQQCVVIKNLVKDLLIDTKVNVLPTTREPNGLAMSSRNAYLSPEIKLKSSIIFESLSKGEELYNQQRSHGEVPVDIILQKIRQYLYQTTDFEVEYLSINHPETLEELQSIDPQVGAIVSTAVAVPRKDSQQTTRLIDNVILSKV